MLLSIKKSAYGIYEWPFSDYHNFSNHVEHYHGFNRKCNFPNCDVGSKSIQEFVQHHVRHTGKSFSEALILASTNAQYDKRLFIDLQVQYVHENYKLRTCCVHKLFFCLCFDI